METGITGMIQKQNSCYHSMNVLTVVGLHIIFILSDWSITQQLLHKCVMVYMGDILQNGKWRLVYYDSSHAHTTSYVQQFLARKRKRRHSLHLRSCPDLDSCDLFLLPKMKLKFKEIIQNYLQVVLNGITKDEIQTWCFWQWQNHRAWYTNSLSE